MTEQPEAQREITFQGRQIWVRFPTPEQLLVWNRILTRLQSADATWDGQQMLAALERVRKIIDSLMLHDADKDWLDDQMLDGTVDLTGAAEIIQSTVEAFQADDNREDRRAAKKAPTKKANRRPADR